MDYESELVNGAYDPASSTRETYQKVLFIHKRNPD